MSAQPKFNSRGQMIEELDEYSPPLVSHVSILGKRKFNDAFEQKTFDDTRYGQHIDTNFFDKNVGHSVVERKDNVKIYSYQEEQEILQWCHNYLASKNK